MLGDVAQAIVEFDDGRLQRLPGEDLEGVLDPVEALVAGETGPPAAFDLRVKAQALKIEHIRTGSLSSARIEPLPHQILLVDKILSQGLSAHLIADDVGLGKTIEAGMLYMALSAQGSANRTLIVTPAGLALQWQEVLEDTFGVVFDVFNRDFSDTRPETWNRFDRVIGSIDSLKRNRASLDGELGRRDMLAEAEPWDLVMFDEAHRLSAREANFGVERTQNYQLAEMLRQRCRSFYLLTATPHQGKEDRFRHLLRLIDPSTFDGSVYERDLDAATLNRLMSRNRKSVVTDIEGRLLFRGHKVIPEDCPLSDAERCFYEGLTTYLCTGFGKADSYDGTMQRAIGFVMTTFQKLAASSLAAIESALQKRYQKLTGQSTDAVAKKNDAEQDARFEGERDEADERIAQTGTFFDEEEEMLASLLVTLAGLPRDSKVDRLIGEIDGLDALAAEQGRQPEHVLVFTEYRASQALIVESLEGRFGKDCCVQIHGDMSLNQKRASQRRFARDVRFLVSTEAGGEGINLHEGCHIVFNFDMPWNPMRLHQRIGRLDRYGQQHQVLAFNFLRRGTIEERVGACMAQKIRAIMTALSGLEGDTSDDLHEAVLGQVGVELDLNRIYAEALKAGGELPEQAIDAGLRRVKEAAERMAGLYGMLQSFDFRSYEERETGMSDRELGEFVEHYLKYRGKRVFRNADGSIHFNVPDELRKRRLDPKQIDAAVFDRKDLGESPEAVLLAFGDKLFDRMISDCLSADFGGQVCSRTAIAPKDMAVHDGYQFVFVIQRRAQIAMPPTDWEVCSLFVSPEGEVDAELGTFLAKMWSASDDQGQAIPTTQEARMAHDRAAAWIDAHIKGRYPDELSLLQVRLLACARIEWAV